MRVHRNIDDLPPFRNAVVTIGTYDGVHRGHQQIIKRINQIAERQGGESIIVTFHPHPRLVINPDDTSLQLINTLEEKAALLDKYEVDNLVVVPFSREFSQQPPEDYIQDFLWKKFQPKVIVIGYDHHFGNNREGDIHMMREHGKRLGFEVEEISKQTVSDIAVSSTKVRKALAEGKVEKAHEFLGHPFSITGVVVKGENKGKSLGFPTANIEVANPNKLIPTIGVYAIKAQHNGTVYDGMLNIGTRPTFDGNQETIEAHLFDFDKDIYGEHLQVDFIRFVRNEIKFNSADELIDQLKKDEETVKKILN